MQLIGLCSLRGRPGGRVSHSAYGARVFAGQGKLHQRAVLVPGRQFHRYHSNDVRWGVIMEPAAARPACHLLPAGGASDGSIG